MSLARLRILLLRRKMAAAAVAVQLAAAEWLRANEIRDPKLDVRRGSCARGCSCGNCDSVVEIVAPFVADGIFRQGMTFQITKIEVIYI